MLSIERKKQMVADDDFDAFIELVLLPIAILLEEQENGGKVSNLLDKEKNPSIGTTREVPNG